MSAIGFTADLVPGRAAERAERRAYRSFVRLIGRRVAQPSVGDAPPVALVPGFISGAVSLTYLGRQLRRAGLRTFRSEMGADLDCPDAIVARLSRRLET